MFYELFDQIQQAQIPSSGIGLAIWHGFSIDSQIYFHAKSMCAFESLEYILLEAGQVDRMSTKGYIGLQLISVLNKAKFHCNYVANFFCLVLIN